MKSQLIGITPSNLIVTKQSHEMRKANGFRPSEFMVQISYRVTQSGRYEYVPMSNNELKSFIAENGFELKYYDTYAGDEIFNLISKGE